MALTIRSRGREQATTPTIDVSAIEFLRRKLHEAIDDLNADEVHDMVLMTLAMLSEERSEYRCARVRAASRRAGSQLCRQCGTLGSDDQ